MLLKDLQEGQKFVFEDVAIPLRYSASKALHSAIGAFYYMGIDIEKVGTSSLAVIKLKHALSTKIFNVVAETGYRSVLLILG